jgi:uncharacterized protein (TIGR02246 family)
VKKPDFLLATILSCILTAPAWAAEPPKSDPVIEDIKAVLRQHDEAMNKQDLKALMGFYTDDPNVALIGTGPGEFWKGKAAVEETYKEFFKDFKAGSLKHECPDVSGGYDGNIAWLVASCNMQDTFLDGQAREYALNVSAVLKREKAGWRFQTLHFSNLTSDDVPPPEDDGSPATEGEKPAVVPAPAEPPVGEEPK